MMDAEINAFIELLDASSFNESIKSIKFTNAITKDAKLSAEARKEGNYLYNKDNHDSIEHDQIFKLYCKSVALAPNDSNELAYAYGNRSAFLFHIKRYKNCIDDIDRVLSMAANLSALKEKLVRRKEQCLLNLQASMIPLGKLGLPEEAATFVKTKDSNKNISKCSRKALKVNEKSKNNLLRLKKEVSIFESVGIEYSNEHGRHLVAKKDFNAGDVIFVEKPFCTNVNPGMFHITCSHCLSICWSGIPCQNCNLAMFCSEACKEEAMKQYHDIECPVITHMKTHIDRNIFQLFFQSYHISVKSIIIGLKEAGSLEKLREEINSVDQCKDKRWRGFKNGEQFCKNRFNNLYSLSASQRKSYLWEIFKIFNELSLIYFAKLTTIFGEELDVTSIQDITNNPDIIFFGSLIYKFWRMERINCHSVKNPERIKCMYGITEGPCMKNCCSRGYGLFPVASLINHSCYNNATRCFAENGKIIIYALQPIKQNSEIFDCYRRNFYTFSKEDRQETLNLYEFVCDCVACKNDWPPILDEFDPMLLHRLKPAESHIYSGCTPLLSAIEHKQPVVNLEKAMETLSTSLMKAFKVSRQPSPLLCDLMQAMEYIFPKKYGYKAEDLGHCLEYTNTKN